MAVQQLPAIREARVIRAVGGVAVGEVGSVCIVVWRGDVTWPRFEVQSEGLTKFVARHPEGAAFVCLIEPTAGPPDDALRRHTVEMVRRVEPSLRAIACVVEGTGFRPSIARSALSAMTLLMRRRTVPISVFDTSAAAAPWLERHTPLRDPRALVGAVAVVRAALPA